MKPLIAYIKREAVLTAAFLCALISMVFIPPSIHYVSYVDFRVLGLLFCLMAVVAGLEDCGLFSVLAQKLLAGRENLRLLCFILVFLPFFTSMVITNDVSLITFVPFAILVLGLGGNQRLLIPVIVLQTIAANLGSMATPIGNPQNLFLYTKFHLSALDFFTAMLPLTLISLAALAVACLFIRGQAAEIHFTETKRIRGPKQLVLMLLLLLLSLLSVFRILPYGIPVAAVFLSLVMTAPRLLRRVDYSLLLTFVCFFIFAGNIGELEPVRAFLSAFLTNHTALTSAVASQVISNVPAAVLLSGFTQDWRGLLLGANIGGLGTPIASLASLISLKLYSKSADAHPIKYLAFFTAANLIGLALLFAVSFAFGWI